MIASIIIILLISFTQRSEATATLEITLTSFTNPGGKDFSGTDCDYWPGASCDHRFYFGLDQQNGDINDAKKNSIMIKITGEFPNSNSNSFQTNANVNGVYNPMTQSFASWPGAVLFKVYIEDVDLDSPDYVDSIVYQMQLTPSESKDSATPIALNLQGVRTRTSKTTLAVSVRLFCDQNFYGADCSVGCQAKNNNDGHYTCDPNTGAVICRPGWEDSTTQCTIFSDDCVGSRCQNGAICVDGIRNYTCSCLPGYSGRFCEANIDNCLSGPCVNGGVCTDLVNDFSCACMHNFVGKNCNSTACTKNNPCRNGGTCYGDSNCYCTRGFIDPTCSTLACKIIPCRNSGVCGVNGLCDCPLGTLGDQCEILLCDVVAPFCRNGATCNKGKCICPFNFGGELCEVNNLCKTVVCQHSGTCVPEMGVEGWTVRCLCTSSYSGERCETFISKVDPPKESVQLPPTNDFNFLAFTEGRLMLAFIIFSFILIVVIIILSLCLCFRRNRSSTKSTRVESHEVSMVSTSVPSTLSTLPRSPPPKYHDEMNSSKFSNHYVIDDVARSGDSTCVSRRTSSEESPYAILDENQLRLKVKDENDLNLKVQRDSVDKVKVLEGLDYPQTAITEDIKCNDIC